MTFKHPLSADVFQRWFAVIELAQADEMALTFHGDIVKSCVSGGHILDFFWVTG